MEIMAAIKKDNKLAEDWLLFYKQRKKQYYIDRQTIFDATCFSDIGARCGVGNQTMVKGIQLAQLMQQEAWLETIEVVEESLSEQKKLFLALRREAVYSQDNSSAGRPPWVEYVQERFYVLNDKFVHENTVKRWWRELVDHTVIVAFKKKCLQ